MPDSTLAVVNEEDGAFPRRRVSYGADVAGDKKIELRSNPGGLTGMFKWWARNAGKRMVPAYPDCGSRLRR